mgnify:CR=1 FL=1
MIWFDWILQGEGAVEIKYLYRINWFFFTLYFARLHASIDVPQTLNGSFTELISQKKLFEKNRYSLTSL